MKRPHPTDRRTANVLRVRVDKLDFHPRLALVPLLEEIASQTDHHGDPKRKERLERLAGDWAAFVADIKENGVLDPIKVVRGGKGRFLVVDGRNRVTGARSAEVTSIPVILVKAEDVDMIVQSTVIGRRHWTKSMKAWLAVLMNPGVIKNAPGGDQRSDHSHKIGMVSRGQLAGQFGVSDALIDQACDIHKGCYDAKGRQTKFGKTVEPSIWLGASLGGIKSALGAEEEADGQGGKAKPDSSSKGYLRKLTPFITNLTALSKWDPALKAASHDETVREFSRLDDEAVAWLLEAAQASRELRAAEEAAAADAKPKAKPASKPELTSYKTRVSELRVGQTVQVGTSLKLWKVTRLKDDGKVIVQRPPNFIKNLAPDDSVLRVEEIPA